MPNRKKRIIYLADNRLSLDNAAIVNIVEMCNAFAKGGFDTTLIVPDCGMTPNSLFEHHGVRYPFKILRVKVPKIFMNKILPGLVTIFSWRSLSELKKLDFNIIYTRTAWIFFFITALLKRRCFYESHQFKFNGVSQTFIYRCLVKIAIKSGHGTMVCISNSLKNHWTKEGIDPRHIYVAHDGVNLDKYQRAHSKEDARRELGLEQHRCIVTYTGSLIPGKGVGVLVKSANRLPEVTFLIVGGTEVQIEELKSISNKNNVIFTGRVAPTKIPKYQAAADILALPNTRGSVIDDVTSPMKLFEYMACRRPIVATDMPSILEVLKPHHNALISRNGDDYELSENIKLLAMNPSLGKGLVENAWEDLGMYTWDTRIAFLTHLFEGNSPSR